MNPATHRKTLTGKGSKTTSPRRTLPLENASPRSSTPARTIGHPPSTAASGSVQRSSTTTPGGTGSPSRSLTGVAKDSVLTKQADAAIADLDSKLQAQIDAMMSKRMWLLIHHFLLRESYSQRDVCFCFKVDEMSTRVTSLDESIQALLKNDFDDSDRSSTPQPIRRSSTVTEAAEHHGERTSSPQAFEESLLDEKSPFY
ncbi:hypothetical protein FRC17_004057 [Serendipita sp. 399]|nr:hypothetical protein FRC17_004057 [Serendipita sp. 399]